MEIRTIETHLCIAVFRCQSDNVNRKCAGRYSGNLHQGVSGILLPRRSCFDAGDEFFVIDKAVEEVVPFLI